MIDDTQDTHYKRMLNRILEVFGNFKKGIGDTNTVQDIVRLNINALDDLDMSKEEYNIDKERLRRIKGFAGGCCDIIYHVDEDKQYEATVKLIEEYEPLIYEALKVDR